MAFKRNVKSFRKNKKSKKKLEEIKSQRRLIKSKLDPLTYAMMMREVSVNPKNDWIKTSLKKIEEEPYMISDKWINSLNKWNEEYIKSLSATDPELEEGKRMSFILSIAKISPPNPTKTFPEWSCILIDDGDWKYYAKSKHFQKEYNAGDLISFDAKVGSNGEGITFLSRVTKLQKIKKDV